MQLPSAGKRDVSLIMLDRITRNRSSTVCPNRRICPGAMLTSHGCKGASASVGVQLEVQDVVLTISQKLSVAAVREAGPEIAQSASQITLVRDCTSPRH